jgi:hypothetical protein
VSTEEQSTYLNDHLAGAAAALDLLDSLEDDRRDTPFQELVARLKTDIGSDRDQLVAVMERLDIKPAALKQLGAQVGETAVRVKSSEMVTGSSALTGLQRTEALIVGISGKIAAWTSLKTSRDPRLESFDFDALIVSAQNQQAHLEQYRVKAAAIIFE